MHRALKRRVDHEESPAFALVFAGLGRLDARSDEGFNIPRRDANVESAEKDRAGKSRSEYEGGNAPYAQRSSDVGLSVWNRFASVLRVPSSCARSRARECVPGFRDLKLFFGADRNGDCIKRTPGYLVDRRIFLTTFGYMTKPGTTRG